MRRTQVVASIALLVGMVAFAGPAWSYGARHFNNTGTQVSVLLIQNPSDATVTGDVYFWGANGTLLATQPFTAAARNLISLSTPTVAPDVSGTITVAHDGRYGDLAGKAVSLEPATGFSFDTLLEPRPN